MLEIAEIFRDAGGDYRERHGDRMPPSHRKVMAAIEACRTAALGGHIFECDRCHHREFSYHSCRNRHCSKCHRAQTEAWLDAQRQRLPACPYYLVTFTVPAQLRDLVRSHQRVGYRILFSAAARSLFALTDDPKFLAARPGVLAVLHTWTRALLYHPHVHMLVTAGGVRPAAGRRADAWVEPRRSRFLVPGYALSLIFRAKFKDGLRRAGLLDSTPPKVWEKDWVVHLQHAGSGERALEYLARYVFRVALVNSRLERYEAGRVTFRYRDNRTREPRRVTLEVHEFIARFLQHVLPSGFTKVRSYGLFAPSNAKTLARVRQILPRWAEHGRADSRAAAPRDGAAASDDTVATNADTSSQPSSPARPCPECDGGVMHPVEIVPRQGRSPP